MIKILKGDINHQTVDAIVNAANSRLAGGGGVDGAIHKAGGPSILEECRVIFEQNGQCPPGQAVITGGGRLPAKYVIHAVGPVRRGGQSNEAEVLANAYRASLSLAEQYELNTIAFPSISTGAYGFPIELAASIALKTINEFIATHTKPKEVSMVLFDDFTWQTYQSAII